MILIRQTKRVFLAALAAALLFTGGFAKAEEIEIRAYGAVLVEAGSGRTLYTQNATRELPMASTTKIMTALLAIEQCGLNETVTVPDCAYGAEGSSIYLNRGEKMLLSDLLYGLMLSSGNDAAIAIACHVAGDVETFAELMNRRAAELGCENTHFVTPNGLHDAEHYSSAADMAKITCAAMKHELFRTIVSTQYHKTESGDIVRSFKNKNRILWEYDGGMGVKTGYTRAAGRCLVFAAERDGMLLVGVVLNCPDMWNAAKRLLDLGFSNYHMQMLLPQNERIATTVITDGEKKHLELVTKTDILYPLRTDGDEKIGWTVSYADAVAAPVEAGDVQGMVSLYVNGVLAAQTELIAKDRVRALTWTGFFHKIICAFVG